MRTAVRHKRGRRRSGSREPIFVEMVQLLGRAQADGGLAIRRDCHASCSHIRSDEAIRRRISEFDRIEVDFDLENRLAGSRRALPPMPNG